MLGNRNKPYQYHRWCVSAVAVNLFPSIHFNTCKISICDFRRPVIMWPCQLATVESLGEFLALGSGPSTCRDPTPVYSIWRIANMPTEVRPGYHSLGRLRFISRLLHSHANDEEKWPIQKSFTRMQQPDVPFFTNHDKESGNYRHVLEQKNKQKSTFQLKEHWLEN